MDKARFDRLYTKALTDSQAVDYSIESVPVKDKFIALVHKDNKEEPVLALASVFRVTDDAGEKTHHVTIAHDGKSMYVMVDDAGLNGTRDQEKQKVAREAVLAQFVAQPGGVAGLDALKTELASTEGMVEKDKFESNFMKRYMASAGEDIGGVAGLVFKEQGPELFNQMQDAFNVRSAELKGQNLGAEKPKQRAAFASLERLAFKVPVLFEGDRGAGKTYDAREFASEHGHKLVEMAGHESVEASDMLGYYVPTSQAGSMAWKDGALTEAFRAASKGEATVLILDELLRIPQRQLSVLLTSLTPGRDGTYSLRTGRMTNVVDGMGTEEVIKCPISNLAIIATTNVGQGYAVDEMDPALKERFVPIFRETSEKQLQAILEGSAKKLGLGDAVAPALSFYRKMRGMYDSGQLDSSPTVRTVLRAFELAEGDLGNVKEGLKGQAILWTARDVNGKPTPEQVKLVSDLVDASFAKELAKAKDLSKDRGV